MEKQVKQERVLEEISEPGRLYEAWQQVKKNAGAAGVDGMTVEEFEERKEELLPILHEKLRAGTYRIKPAERVLIPKAGSNKMRPLSIPCLMDRIMSQSINSVFGEIFDPGFTESNFGFRKGKNQHQAIRHVQKAVKEGYDWCVLIDLENFFGEIPHNLIFQLIRRRISDERLVTMIARILKSGVIIDGEYEKTEKGCHQGSPLSPMLGNIVLNELDQELDRRGLRYSRWADDFVILVKSERAAGRVMESVIRYLERLGLKVKKEKEPGMQDKSNDVLEFRNNGRETESKRKSPEAVQAKGKRAYSPGKSVIYVSDNQRTQRVSGRLGWIL